MIRYIDDWPLGAAEKRGLEVPEETEMLVVSRSTEESRLEGEPWPRSTCERATR
jgi:hypothetical protein